MLDVDTFLTTLLRYDRRLLPVPPAKKEGPALTSYLKRDKRC